MNNITNFSYGEGKRQQLLASFGTSDSDIEKSNSGEGSRGGKVIGYTKSGKPVYVGRMANHVSYKDFTSKDHHDAATLHAGNSGSGSGKIPSSHSDKDEDEDIDDVQNNASKNDATSNSKPKINDFDDEEKTTISTLKKEKKAGHTREETHNNVFGKDHKSDSASKMLDHVYGKKDIKKSDNDINKAFDFIMDEGDVIEKAFNKIVK